MPAERLGEIGGYWLSKRPDGRSEQSCRTWYDKAARQTRCVSLGTTDLEEAKLALAAWVTTSATAQKDQRPQEVTLGVCIARYWEHHARHLKSAEPTRYGLQKWNEFFPGALSSEITPAAQRQFVTWMREANLSDGYIRRVLAVGQGALNSAVDRGEIASVPKILLKLAPEAEPRERIASPEELRWLFRAAVERHQFLYLMLGLGTAARPAAILDLTSDRVDLQKRLINLLPRGQKQNKKRRPIVPICDALLPLLRDLPPGPVVQWQGRQLKSARMMFGHLVNRAARMMCREAAARVRHLRATNCLAEAWDTLRDARQRATAILEITPYTLRHTVGEELRAREANEWEAAGFMGHTMGHKTTGRYAKYRPSYRSARSTNFLPN